MSQHDYHSGLRSDIVHLVPQAGKLLDVGGGTGATARHLRKIGRVDQIGVMDAVVDEHSDGLDFASSADLNDPVAAGEFLHNSGPYDVILLLDVLEHLVDPWAMVDVFAQHVRPGGLLIASIPNVRHHSASIPLIFGNSWDYADAGILDRTHLRFFVKDTAIKLMDRPGLTITDVESSPIGARKLRLINVLSLGLLRSFFTLQYFVVARRNG